MVEVRIGDVVFRNGQGFSERRPTVKESLRRKLKPTFVSGSGGGRTAPAPTPKPKVPISIPAPAPTPKPISKPQATVEKFRRPRGGKVSELIGLQKRIAKSRQQRELLRTKKLREKITPREEAKLVALTARQTAQEFGAGIVDLPETLRKVNDITKGKEGSAIENIIKNRKNIAPAAKTLKTNLKREGKNFGILLKTSPSEALILIGSNILLAEVGGRGVKILGKLKPSAKVNIRKRIKSGNLKKSGVVFAGVQKKVGNKIITELVFKTTKGKVGKALAKTLPKGDKSVTAVVGRAGKIIKKGTTIKPKAKLKELETFAGIQASKSVVKNIKKQVEFFSKEGGLLNPIIATENIEAVIQLSRGKTAQAKGRKLQKLVFKIPKGKFVTKNVRSLKFKDFVSASRVLTKGDISAIAGKTLTSKGELITFVGLIKGSKDATKIFKTLSKSQQQKYVKALRDTAGILTASSTKTSTILPKLSVKARVDIAKRVLPPKTVATLKKTGITGVALVNAIEKTKAIQKISAIPKAKVIPRGKVTAQVIKAKTKQEPTPKTIPKTKPKATPITKQVPFTRGSTKQQPRQVPRQQPKQEPRQVPRQQPKQQPRQVPRQQPRQVPRQKTKQKAKLAFKTPVSVRARVSTRAKAKKVPTLKIRKRKKRLPRIIKKTEKGFNVFARPLKKTKKGKKPKLVKVNKVPLTKKQAEDLRNYITDTSLARTSKIKPTKLKPEKAKLKVPRGYAKKSNVKFRNYKTVKGKRVKLPKGKVIERKTRLLDTKQEKKQITLRKRIKQLEKPIKKKAKRKVKK